MNKNARIAELEAALERGLISEGSLAHRVNELEATLWEIAKGKSWASNGLDLDGESRLSRRAMKDSARRTLEGKA